MTQRVSAGLNALVCSVCLQIDTNASRAHPGSTCLQFSAPWQLTFMSGPMRQLQHSQARLGCRQRPLPAQQRAAKPTPTRWPCLLPHSSTRCCPKQQRVQLQLSQRCKAPLEQPRRRGSSGHSGASSHQTTTARASTTNTRNRQQSNPSNSAGVQGRSTSGAPACRC